jgi:hypothetical protein
MERREIFNLLKTIITQMKIIMMQLNIQMIKIKNKSFINNLNKLINSRTYFKLNNRNIIIMIIIIKRKKQKKI